MCSAMTVPAAAPAAIDMFLELDGIEGESMDSQYPDTIQVLAWSSGARGKAGNKPVNVQDLSLTKYIDQASTPLFSALTTGTPISDGKLIVRARQAEQADAVPAALHDRGAGHLALHGRQRRRGPVDGERHADLRHDRGGLPAAEGERVGRARGVRGLEPDRQAAIRRPELLSGAAGGAS